MLRLKNIIKKKYIDKINIDLISNSELFNKKYYLLENPEVKINPAKHYYLYGYKEGKSPSYNFSNDDYLKMHEDVKNSGMNPLIHYLKYGKYENRIIKKDNGLSLNDYYYKLYSEYYNYNFYYQESSIKRVNFFIDECNDTDIIDYIIGYCKQNKYILRIIYNNFNIQTIKKHIKFVDESIEFLYLNNNDYIFIGCDDIYFSSGIFSTLALLNTFGFQKKIYTFIGSIDNEITHRYYLSKIANDPKVVLLTYKQENINKYKKNILTFKKNNSLTSNKLYFEGNELMFEGLSLLNKLFLEEIYDPLKYTIHIVNNDVKCHLDSDVIMYNLKKDNSAIKNEIFTISSTIDSATVISGYLNETDDYICFNLINNENYDLEQYVSAIDNYDVYENFKNMMIDVKLGEKDV